MNLRKSLQRALRLRCPHCGEAAIYAGLWSIREHCSHCGLRLQREPGYFMGALYLNVVVTLTVLLGVLVPVLFARPDIGDAFYGWMVAAAVILPLLFLRHSRALWLSVDYSISPPKLHEFSALVTSAQSRTNSKPHDAV